jgi:hypothetical protein
MGTRFEAEWPERNTAQPMLQTWQHRSPYRIPDDQWNETMIRVRGEFEEMPSLRVTPRQACMLFGLSETVSLWVLSCLARDGFLEQARDGEYLRRNTAP